MLFRCYCAFYSEQKVIFLHKIKLFMLNLVFIDIFKQTVNRFFLDWFLQNDYIRTINILPAEITLKNV